MALAFAFTLQPPIEIPTIDVADIGVVAIVGVLVGIALALAFLGGARKFTVDEPDPKPDADLDDSRCRSDAVRRAHLELHSRVKR